MKAFLVSLALALFFAVGTASAGSGAAQGGDSDSCGHYKEKFQDT